MTKEEINDLKRKHNALLKEGQALWEKLEPLSDEMMAIRKTLEREEGDGYDPVPLIFGSGFWIDDDDSERKP